MKDSYADTMRAAFREEAGELLTELEASLLELEEDSADQELIDRVFRAMHTIKGSGAMFGFEEIADFTHEVETVFDRVRNGEMPVTKELIDLTLAARDQIREMLETGEEGGLEVSEKNIEIISKLRRLIKDSGGGAGPGPSGGAVKEGEGPQPGPAERVSYRIRFRPASDIFLHGTNPVLLLDELRELGECEVTAHTGDLPNLEEINAEHCYTFWDIILTTDRGENAIRDVFIFVEDDSELKIEAIAEEEGVDRDIEYKKLGEILIERGDIDREKLKKVLAAKQPIGEILVEAGLVGTEEVESALIEQQLIKQAKEKRRKVEMAASIRVRSDKLDGLVDLVGELVTVQAHLSQTAGGQADPELLSISEEVERLISELRDTAMSLRMVPIGSTFSKFQRLVRDLSGEMGKEIELTTEGAETELDKTVIERLGDPLVHLIRNCIDHGIEPPEQREGLGKLRSGRIHLRSGHSGAYVVIQIADDGAGLDREKILESALNMGLVAQDSELSEKEIFNLTFTPGFSTVKEVTGVSGRGVGMDVVKRTVDALGGSVEIESERGKGTTITLKIPLTLAIIEGLLVKLGGDFYVLPLSVVEECVELSREDAAGSHGRHLANVRGSLLPYVNLREMFRYDGEAPDIEHIVVASIHGHRVGFLVDHVIGKLQTVIKNLGRVYRDLEGISGATILGDGAVALILDVLKLAQKAESEEKALYG